MFLTPAGLTPATIKADELHHAAACRLRTGYQEDRAAAQLLTRAALTIETLTARLRAVGG